MFLQHDSSNSHKYPLYSITQGTLKKWTEHSLELHLFENTLIFWTITLIILKSSYQDLSNEGPKKILSSLELVF